MDKTYTAIQGDSWDIIAKKVYGHEKYADHLMKNNFDKLDIFIFSSGEIIKTPELDEEIDSDLPEWRR